MTFTAALALHPEQAGIARPSSAAGMNPAVLSIMGILIAVSAIGIAYKTSRRLLQLRMNASVRSHTKSADGLLTGFTEVAAVSTIAVAVAVGLTMPA